MVAQGVFCPNREAKVEMDGDFTDQYANSRVKVCWAENCLRKNEINSDPNIENENEQPYRRGEDGTEWEVILCDSCGEVMGSIILYRNYILYNLYSLYYII